jgi:hypothetical protein
MQTDQSYTNKTTDEVDIFFWSKGDQTIAELTYSSEDGVMTIDHTETNPSMKVKA